MVKRWRVGEIQPGGRRVSSTGRFCRKTGGEAGSVSGGASVGSVRWVLGFEAGWSSSRPCIKRFQMVRARIGYKRYTGTTTEFPPNYECEGMMGDSFEASKKRSDEIRADLSVNPGKYCMLITDRDTTANIQDNVYNMVIDYLACGIDPEKTIIFTHSQVPALNQLMLPFLSLCTEAELERNPTVKSEQEASGHALTGLLLTYPVHQACDILFCKGNIVPVGKDQLPHIEQTRQIARRFNERYGHVFPEPEGLLTDAVLIPGLDGRKMSKSYGNAISLAATAEETAKLIKKSQTDSERFITFDPDNRPGVSALITTASLCTGRGEQEIAEEIGNGGSGQLKKYVTESVNDFLAPIRERRVELMGDMDYVKDVLREGNRRANEIANQTLEEVREAMGMVY